MVFALAAAAMFFSCSDLSNELRNLGFLTKSVVLDKSLAPATTKTASSADTGVVTAVVKEDGSVVFTGHSAGTAQVTVTGQNEKGENVTTIYKVTADPSGNITYEVSGSFTNSSVTVTEGSSIATADKIASLDDSIVMASIDQDGRPVFDAVAPGTTNVIVNGVDKDGNLVSANYQVTVGTDGSISYEKKSEFKDTNVSINNGIGAVPTINGDITNANDDVATVSKAKDASGNDCLVVTGHKPGTTIVTVPVIKGDKEGTAAYQVTVAQDGSVTYEEIGAESSVLNAVDKFFIQDLELYNIENIVATTSNEQNTRVEVREKKLWVFSLKDEDATATVTVTGTRSHDAATDKVILYYDAVVESSGAVQLALAKSQLEIKASGNVSVDELGKEGVVTVERSGDKAILTACDIGAGASDQTVLTLVTQSNVSSSYNLILSSYGRIVYGFYKGINFVLNDSVNGNPINDQGDPITSVAQFSGAARWHIPQMVTPMVNPTMTGYTFRGWFKEADFSGQAVATLTDADFGDSAGITLYAKWTANQYKIQFYQNNERGDATGTMPEMSCWYDREYSLTQNTFDRQAVGVTWLNWNSEVDGSGTDYADKQKVKNLRSESGAEYKLYALWKGNKYKVAFNSNVPDNAQPTVDPTAALTGEMADQDYECGIPQKLTANAYAIVGYTFGGWNTKADGTGTNYVDSYNAYSLTVVDGDTFTMYAKWTPNANTAYKVRHLQQDYKNATELADTYKVKDTETKSGTTWANTVAASKTYSGFTCEGVAQNHINADGSTVIDIKYRRHKFTVNFNVNNTYKSGDSTATDSGSMASQSFVYGSPQNLRTNAFGIKGYTFAGWATSSGGSKAYNDKADGSTVSTSDGGTTTLYAKWTANTNTAYKVVHQRKRASEVVGTENENKTGTTGANTAATAKSGGNYTGFTAESITQTKIKADGSSSVTIVYNKNTYKVTFVGNGASGANVDQTGIYHGEATALRANTFSRQDYKFKGWSENASATTATWADGASITLTGNKTLYAVWEEDMFCQIKMAAIVVRTGGVTKYVDPSKWTADPSKYAGCTPVGVVINDTPGSQLMVGLERLYGADKNFGLAYVEQWANNYSVDGYTSGWRVPTIDELRYIPSSGNYNTVNSAYTLVSNKGNGLCNNGFSSTPTGTEGQVYIIVYTREDKNYTGDASVRMQQNGDIVHSLP